MKKYILAVLCVLFVFVSCSSLQRDVIVSTGDSVLDKRSEILLQKLLILDGEYYLNNKSLNDGTNKLNNTATELASLIQSEIDAKPQNRQFLATLYGMLGRVNLLQGKDSQAESLYLMGKNIQQGDPQVIVLGIRLQKKLEQRETTLISVMKQSDDEGPLLIEEALIAYEKKEYASSVASFDKAFLKVSQSYRKGYHDIRSHAWDLRDSASGSSDVSEFVNSKSLTAEGMIMILDAQTDVFESVKTSKNYSSSKLFDLINDLGLLTPAIATDGLSSSQYKLKTSINRVLVSRFLWNIYVWQNGKSIEATKYSKKYQKKGSSPIKDVPLSSGDFDAVMGNIQLEVMELPDGVNFYPQDKVLGLEFLQWVKNLGKIL